MSQNETLELSAGRLLPSDAPVAQTRCGEIATNDYPYEDASGTHA